MDSLRFGTPFSMGIFGRRECGKTYFVTKLLMNQERLIIKPFKKVIWIYKSYQSADYEKLSSIHNLESEFLDDLPNFDAMGKQINTLIVIDDMQTEATCNDQVSALFTRGRHFNFSVIYLSQNLFHQGKYARDISLNIDFLVMLKNPRDVTTIDALSRQMYPHMKKFLPWAYNLILDLKPFTDNSMRVFSKIFDQFPILYVPRNL